ncbi:MAG: FtsX-like permease family protein, partial [Thermodesulfobacteriota bacterium]
ISIVGIMVGVMALIVVLSVMKGFEVDLREKILGANAHMVVLKFGGRIKEYHKVIKEVEKVEGVVAATPYIYNQVMLMFRGRSVGVVMKGIDVVSIDKVTALSEKIIEGSLQSLKIPFKSEAFPGILIGKELAASLGVLEGDTVDALTAVGSPTPFGMLPNRVTFRISGIFDFGMYEYDSSLTFISLENAQRFFNMGNDVTGIEMKAEEIYMAKETGIRVADALETNLGEYYLVKNWMELNKNLFAALKLERLAMFIILALIVLVAAFNIISTLIMVVVEKGREIAVLISMGATKKSIMKIFMIEGMVMGIIGTALGVTGGLILDILLVKYPIIKLPEDVYNMDTLPVIIEPSIFLTVSLAALVISFLATLYPSWQASRLDPVEALRHE